jgi:hypothetical protein
MVRLYRWANPVGGGGLLLAHGDYYLPSKKLEGGGATHSINISKRDGFALVKTSKLECEYYTVDCAEYLMIMQSLTKILITQKWRVVLVNQHFAYSMVMCSQCSNLQNYMPSLFLFIKVALFV